jgi:hypothetical protein
MVTLSETHPQPPHQRRYRPRKGGAMKRKHPNADAGYVRLAYAILVQAIIDAAAPFCTWRTDAVQPSAADVRSAQEFLASPAAHWLAARLGLSLKRIRRWMAARAARRRASEVAEPAPGRTPHGQSSRAAMKRTLRPRR